METIPERALRILSADTRSAAGARCIIKRTLRKEGLPVGEPAEFIGWFVAHPWACTQGIERTIEASAKAWVDGNNSGNAATLAREEKRHQELGEDVETLLSAIGVKVDWPGLYPAYEFEGHHRHDLAGLWVDIKESRKNAESKVGAE